MSAIIWPASLPDFILEDGYSEEPRFSKASFQPDTGIPIDRPKSTVALTALSCSTQMDGEQVGIFEDFVRYELSQATQSFRWPHPRREEAVTARLVGDQPYRVTPIGPDLWRVSMTLQIVG